MTELNDSAKLTIRKEVEGYLGKIAAIFGIANLAVVLAALVAFWANASGQVERISQGVREAVLLEISSDRAALETAVGEARELIGQLELRTEQLARVEDTISELEDRSKIQSDALGVLEDDVAIASATRLVESIQSSENINDIISLVDANITSDGSLNCENPKILTGRTEQGATPWEVHVSSQQQEIRSAITLRVPLSNSTFNSAPAIFYNLEGNGGQWSANGVGSLYASTESGFVIHLKWDATSLAAMSENRLADLLAYANNADWYVSWMAVGC